MFAWASSPTSVSDIERKLNEMIVSCLNESTSWPTDSDSAEIFWRALERMGLVVLGNASVKKYTDLGTACGAHLASYFIGAEDPYDVQALLAQEGLIEDQEAQGFYSLLAYYNNTYLAYFKDNFLDGENMADWEVLKEAKRLALKAYRRFCSIKKSERSEVSLDAIFTAGGSTK